MFARLFPLLLAGCATTWITTQATGTQRVWDEDVNEVHVPQPGIEERLAVSVPLVTQYQPASTTSATSATPAAPVALPFALTCTTAQYGRDRVYHQAFRYGSRWKKLAAAAVVVEGALGALMLLGGNEQRPGYYVGGGFLAADAVVTLPLIFVPRKEIYRSDDVAVTTPVRTDCPDGLAFEIGDRSFPVDAAGRIGELGEAAFAEWQRAPTSQLRVSIAGQRRDVPTAGLRVSIVNIVVPPGTLTAVAP